MIKSLLVAALAGLTSAYSAHTGKSQISDQSTKIIGIVNWQYFFDKFVEAEDISSTGSNYDSLIHLCWFQWTATQWASSANEDRWGLTLKQNCPSDLISSFTFQIGWTAQTGNLVLYDGGEASTSIENGLSNVVVSDCSDDATSSFGIMLNSTLENVAAAIGAITYTYTVQLANDGPQTSGLRNPENPEGQDGGPSQSFTAADVEFSPMTNTDTSSCSFVHDRLKLDLVDSEWFVSQGLQFEDPYFSGEDAIVWSDSQGAFGDLESIAASSQYIHAADAGYSKRNGFSLWGHNGIDYNDMSQGYVGNCYMISGAATIAEVPERIQKVFSNEDLNDEGFYQVQLYKLGNPITIQIDDRLPMSTGSKLLFAQIGDDKSLWGPLLEKAFAKFYGNYEVLEAGWAGIAMSAMTGGPYLTLNVKEYSEENLWTLIAELDQRDFMFNASSNHGTGNNDDSTDNNIVFAHAYTLISAVQVNGTKLLKMRNPWATERYDGPWSDSDIVWDSIDQATKDSLGFSRENDGIFFIPMNIFISDFVKIDYIPDTSNMHASRFLMIDDQATYNPDQGSTKFASNVRHDFSVASDVSQKIYLTLYVHHARSYPNTGSCSVQYPWELRKHALVVWSQSKQIDFGDGQGTIELDIEAGQTIDFHAEFGWHTTGITKDFGLVAWGAEAPLVLQHDEGLQSNSWNVDDSSIPEAAYEYPAVSDPATSEDVTNWALHKLSTYELDYCDTVDDYTSQPFLDQGDSRIAIFEGHRCKGRIFSFELIVKEANYAGIELLDDNHVQEDICAPHPSFGGYVSCNVVLGYDSPLVMILQDQQNSSGFFPLRTKGTWTTVETPETQ